MLKDVCGQVFRIGSFVSFIRDGKMFISLTRLFEILYWLYLIIVLFGQFLFEEEYFRVLERGFLVIFGIDINKGILVVILKLLNLDYF